MILNLGCGGTRPPEPFLNVDTLIASFMFAGPEVDQLRAEANYVEYNILTTPWPWDHERADGILASHVIEHFTCLEAREILRQCHRVLKTGGILRVSVPDAAYFRAVYAEDNAENAQRLFGQPLYEQDRYSTMMDYALFFIGHKQVLSEDSLWCLIAQGGFTPSRICRTQTAQTMQGTETARRMAEQDNRAQFSLVMEAVK